ncbi:MAG: hypothetical protein CME65_11125 [Halobacteriovoraceae bacterium]|nr:hypothetical protein [Halobacteriovoraceae bacterium]|tara:strand:+ start:8604 stop:11171 length:2568 start_codon:yes stop_codon:yes gene_type:complete
MNTEHFKSTNGINSLLINSPNSNIVSIQFWFKAGSSLEATEHHGIAHFLEHMFFKGSQKYPAMKIAKTVESFGGEINAFTSFDYTCYYINAPLSHAKKSLDVLLDMVCNPLFLKEDLIPERGVVFEEYLRSVDNPSQYNFFKIQQACFPKGYKHPILGNEKTIKNFNLSQLKKFRSSFYNKQNSMIILAGNLAAKKEYKNLINKYKLPSGKKSDFPEFKLKSAPAFNIHEKPVNQATLTLNIQAPDFSDAKAAQEDLALNALTFGDMSPLYKYFIDETSLANGLSGSTMYFSKGGIHFFRMSFPEKNLSKILRELPNQIQKCLKAGFNQDDLDRIRNQYMASKVYEKESIESFAFAMGHGFAQNGDINSDEQYVRTMEAVHPNDLISSLSEIFSRTVHITLQMPEGLSKSVKIDSLKDLGKRINTAGSKVKKAATKFKVSQSKYDQSAQVIELSKGVKLIHRHNPLSDTFALHCFVKGGLTEETPATNGIYNMMSKNITYGYEGLDYDDLKKDLEKKASYLNGFSGRNAYGLTLQGLSKYNDSLFKHFENTLLRPSFSQDKFLLERELILRTLHIQKQDPVKQCFLNFSNLVFKDHPYRLEMIGNEESLQKMSVKKLKDLHRKNMETKEMVITYCGNYPVEIIAQKCQKLVSEIKRKPILSNHFNRKAPKPLYNQNIEIDFEREQTHLMLGKAAFRSNTKEDAFLKIFTTLLSGQSSELFLKVRDTKGLCYTVQPLHNSSIEAGYWGIYMGTSTEKYNEAIKELKKIISKYQKRGVSKRDFLMVKEMIYGQNIINIQTNDDYAYFYSVPVLHDLGLDFSYKTLEKIKSVKHEDLNNFLKEFLDGGWNLVKIGKTN